MPRAVPRPDRPNLPPAPQDAAARGVVVTSPEELGAVVRWTRGARQQPLEDVAAATGVGQDLLRGLEKAGRNVRLSAALDILAALGYDVVLVPRDPALRLRESDAQSASRASSISKP
jgi:transcriptional regulator with XRE-family HTH domain